MKPSHAGTLRTHVETRHFSPRRGEIEAMRDRLRPLCDATRAFSFANLQVTISFLVPGEEYHVKCRLALPGRVVLTGEHDSVFMPPYESCISKLVHKTELESLRERMRTGSSSTLNNPSDTRNEGCPPPQRLRRAFAQGDYHAFVEELSGYRGAIRDRVRAWVRQRIGSSIEAGDNLLLDDLVDEVALTAFEHYESRPSSLRIVDWLEMLVDPALRSMLGRPDEPDEAVSYARSLHELRAGWYGSSGPGGDKSPHGPRPRWPTERPHGTNKHSADIPKPG